MKNGMKTLVPELRTSHDEADDRIMIHVNHAVKKDCYEFVLICSRDSDVFVSLMYHFESEWKEKGLNELWIENMGSYTPLHDVCANLPPETVEMLPAVHCLTGCDTTSKVGTKKKALALMKTGKHPVLKDFGRNKLDQQMLEGAEKFLVKCLPKSSSVDSFDLLRHLPLSIL